MEQLKGKSIFNGIAIGRILFYSQNQQQVKRNKVDDVEAELKRYENAKAKAIEQLQELYAKAVEEAGEWT